MLRPCSSEIDDGLSLARQYGGRALGHASVPSVAELLFSPVTVKCVTYDLEFEA